MSFHAYRATPFEFTHENKVFNKLYDLLQAVWEDREEPLHLIGNVYVAGRPVDALIIKSHAVVVIDFKDYGGDVSFSENGSWYANGVIVKGGGSTNPYQQIRNNKFTLLNYLQESVVFQSEPQLGHIAGLCLFHQDIRFDDKQIPTGISRWFHVSDMSHVVRTIDAITSTAIDLSGSEIEKIITSLDIPSFNPDGNTPIINAIPQSATDTEKRVRLTPTQQRAIDSATSWLTSTQNTVLSIIGAKNSGKKTVLKIIKDLLSEQGKSPLFLSPNARIANKYKALGFSDVQSIYSWLYASRPSRLEKDKACYDVSLTIPDATREVLIFLDAHLLGDDKFETETTRYGTGYLLQDMLTALIENNAALPKMLLVGDPFQLTRGSIQRSLLIGEVFKDKNIMFSTCELNEQVSSDELSRFQLPLISALSNNTFSRLPDVSGQNVAEVVVGKHTDEIGRALVAWPKRTVFLCAKNVDAFKVNRGIRRKFLMTEDMSILVVGDVVDVHNRAAGINDDFTDTTWINSGTFG
ncbi:NERD domain-containing protein, partial [Vibrio casei]|uniref:NERD domain-containing protein n=3 Tax=Vibrionaceae TaxID=641 RepID=UPI003F9CB631